MSFVDETSFYPCLRARRGSVEHLLNWTLPVILFVIDTVVARSNVVTLGGAT